VKHLILFLAGIGVASPATALVPPDPAAVRARSGGVSLGWAELDLGALYTAARERGVASGPRTVRGGEQRVRALVLLVEFADTTFSSAEHPPTHYDSLLFGVTGPSVRTYYEEISGGRFVLEGDVHPLRRLASPITDYTGDGHCPGCYHGIGDYPYNSQRLVEDLVGRVDPEIDFSPYDGDGDGVVDVLFVVYAGVGAEDVFGARRFASHQWYTVTEPAPDGVTVRSYVMMSEWGGIGGFAHEMAHLFGLPDLYDIGLDSSGVGDWSLMGTGARLGAPKYSNPAHPDPHSRDLLGFLDVDAAPFPGPDASVALAPVESDGEVLRLWRRHELGTEYFLVENRQPGHSTFDGALPAYGLLVYHVDEAVATNENEAHYRVAVEQADGRFDLEGGRDDGDGGDPFPGSTGASAFDVASTPDSRAYDGRSSEVAIRNIEIVGDEIHFDVSVADGPGVMVDATVLSETSGDGDLRPEAAETWALDVTVLNRGRDAPDGTVEISSEVAGVQVDPAALDLPALAPGEARALSDPIEVTLPGFLDVNPARVPIRFVFRTGAFSDTSTVAIVAGDVFGLTEDFEAETAAWTHARVGYGNADPWHRSSARAAGGTFAMKCGDAAGGGYPDSIDAVLTSPTILLGAGSVLSVAHWMYAEDTPPRRAFDGGRVELSTDGVAWRVVDPIGGYTHLPVLDATFDLFDHALFGGYTDGWRTVRFDLSDGDGGPVQIRFRFASDLDNGGALYEGWYVDDVRIETNADSVAFHLFEPVRADNHVEVEWTVVENLRRFEGGVRIERRAFSPGGEPLEEPRILGEWDLDGGARDRVIDGEPTPGTWIRYSLVEVPASGSPIVRAERTLVVPPSTVVPLIRFAGPSPFRPGEAVFRIRIAPAGRRGFECRFFDASGREVARAASRPTDGEELIIEWDGRSAAGKPLGSGVYWYQVEGVPGAGRGRAVLVR
jgi:immune inhibitor A